MARRSGQNRILTCKLETSGLNLLGGYLETDFANMGCFANFVLGRNLDFVASRLGLFRDLGFELDRGRFFPLDHDRAHGITWISGIEANLPSLGNSFQREADMDRIFGAVYDLRIHRDILSLADRHVGVGKDEVEGIFRFRGVLFFSLFCGK